jgi:Phage integrase family
VGKVQGAEVQGVESTGPDASSSRWFLLAWREKTPFAKETDFVFPSVRLKGKKPLSASVMVQKYLRPAAVKAGVLKEGENVRFGFHNFRHALATALVKLKVDAKTIQGMLRHEDFGTTMQLYAQSDMESMRDAQGKFLEQLLGDRIHLLTEKVLEQVLVWTRESWVGSFRSSPPSSLE